MNSQVKSVLPRAFPEIQAIIGIKDLYETSDLRCFTYKHLLV